MTTLTRDAFFGDTDRRPAAELPAIPTEIPRHRGEGHRPWIRKPDDMGPPPPVTVEVDRRGERITVLANPKDGPRGRYYGRASSFGKPLEDKRKIEQADQRRIAYAFGRHPELVAQAQAVKSYEDDRDELQAIAAKAVEYGKGAVASTRGTAFHRLRERRDQGEDLSYLDPLTLQGLATWERLLAPFEVVNSEQFVVNDELEAAGTYDALLRLVRTLTIRHPKTGEVLGVLERGEAVCGDLKSGRWGPDWFGPTYLCQGLIYPTGQPYSHERGRYDWAVTPSQRWAVIPYVSLDRLDDAGLHWIDLDRARRAVAAVQEVKAIRADKLAFIAHSEEPMPADLRAAGERAVDGQLVEALVGSFDRAELLGLISQAKSRDELNALWAQHQAVWTDEHTAWGNAVLRNLAGGAA
jgi:hypothetical protein